MVVLGKLGTGKEHHDLIGDHILIAHRQVSKRHLVPVMLDEIIHQACSEARAGCRIAITRAFSFEDGAAMPELLDAAADVIEKRWTNLNPPLLMHCGAGIERSPLTVVWWMRRRFG